MPSLGVMRALCESRNRIERGVIERRLVPLSLYMDKAVDNNLAITLGSSPIQRENAILAALRTIRRKRNGLIVVISNSDSLEVQIRNAIGQNGLGPVWIPDNKNGYDLFVKMDPAVIRDLFRLLANRLDPMSAGQLYPFFEAFLEIMQRTDSLNLSDMVQWARRTDKELYSVSEKMNIPEVIRNGIRINTIGGLSLRSIINDIAGAFRHIGSDNCNTNANISTLCDQEQALIFIRDKSSLPDVFRMVLMKELEAVMSESRPLTIVFDSINPTENNYVRELINYSLHRDNIHSVLCGNNLWSMFQPNSEQILAGFKSWVIYNPAGMQVDEFLSRFGTYTYHYPVLSAGNENFLFTNYTEATEQRQRIRSQDLLQYEVLLSGHHDDYLELVGEIT